MKTGTNTQCFNTKHLLIHMHKHDETAPTDKVTGGGVVWCVSTYVRETGGRAIPNTH